jgi:hypothetical protein
MVVVMSGNLGKNKRAMRAESLFFLSRYSSKEQALFLYLNA